MGVEEFRITDEERNNPKAIPKWPSSGLMADYGINPLNRPPHREFLHYLSDWHYRDHSQQSHMSFFGMLKLSGVLLADDQSQEDREVLNKDRLPKLMTAQMSRA